MWILTVNNVEIDLPVKDEVFFATVNSAEMVSTDFDIYYNDKMLDVFELRGILEVYNGKRYKAREYDGYVSNPLASNDTFECVVTINSISLTNKKLNMTVKANTSGMARPYNKEYYHMRELLHQNVTDRTLFPLNANIPTGEPHVWSGYHLENMASGSIVEKTKLYRGWMRDIPPSEYIPNIGSFGYKFVNMPLLPVAYYATPNSLYGDGDIKMRRGTFRAKTKKIGRGSLDPATFDVTTDICFACKGDYVGVYDDDVECWYTKTYNSASMDNGDMTFVVHGHWTNKDTMRKSRIYYKYWWGSNTSDMLFGCSEPFYIQIRTRNGITYMSQGLYNTTTRMYEYNPSTVGYEDWHNYDMKDSYFEFLPYDTATFPPDTRFGWKMGFTANTAEVDDLFFDFQQHWDDDYKGYEKIVGQDGDTQCEYDFNKNDANHPECSLHMLTRHFDSRGWGCNHISDYTGHIITGFTTDTGYNEPFYNTPSGQFCPLMYTDEHLCLDATIFDIIWNFAYVYGLNLSIDTKTKTITFGGDIYTRTLDEYVTGEEISFSQQPIYWQNLSELKYLCFGSSADNGECYYKSDEISTIKMSAVRAWDANGDYGDSDIVYNCHTPVKFNRKEETEVYNDVTLLAYTRRVLSGDHSNQSPHPIMDRNMYAMQFAGKGWVMWTPDELKAPSPKSTKASLIDQPPVMKVKINGIITSFYVIVHDRTWWVKSQEVEDNGGNTVELILYQ